MTEQRNGRDSTEKVFIEAYKQKYDILKNEATKSPSPKKIITLNPIVNPPPKKFEHSRGAIIGHFSPLQAAKVRRLMSRYIVLQAVYV
jgi:hypothetical protein